MQDQLEFSSMFLELKNDVHMGVDPFLHLCQQENELKGKIIYFCLFSSEDSNHILTLEECITNSLLYTSTLLFARVSFRTNQCRFEMR